MDIASIVVPGVFIILNTFIGNYLSGVNNFKNKKLGTISPKERFEIFCELEKLKQDESPWGKQKTKALYERMGMYSMPSFNEFLLEYVHDKNIRYDNTQLNAFINIAGFNRLDDNDQIQWTRKKYIKYRWALWGTLVFVTPLFIIAFYSFYLTGREAEVFSWNSYIPYSSAIMIVLNIFAMWYLILHEDKQQKNAWKFYNKFKPWLNERNEERKSKERVKDVMPDCKRESKSLLYKSTNTTMSAIYKIMAVIKRGQPVGKVTKGEAGVDTLGKPL